MLHLMPFDLLWLDALPSVFGLPRGRFLPQPVMGLWSNSIITKTFGDKKDISADKKGFLYEFLKVKNYFQLRFISF